MRERILLTISFCGLAVVPFIYAVSGEPRFASYSFHPVLAWLGATIFLLALVLFYETHRALGRSWSVTLEVREAHKLVTEGIYRYVRHPMYTAFWLWAVAQALLLPNWIAGFSGIVGFGTLFAFRIRREEAMMLAAFGEEYRAYQARTKRIIPGVF
jgi:protein-S-isoprenylcysteine O-methyltransferase Ste14